jgi:formate dehydrogenase major subunit
VAGIATLFAGASYERLDGWKSLLWPVKPDGTDTPLLYTDRFHTDDGKAVLYPLEWKPPAEAPDSEFDLMLDNGRMLEHFQGNNQTGRGDRIDSLSPDWYVEISPELAAERGIEEGTRVRITSRRGSVTVPVLITDRVRGKVLFLPIHQGKPGINELTGEHHDPDVNTPAYKETAVKMTVLRDSPQRTALPRGNFRNGHRTPNDGVAVAVKWARDDYAPIDAPAPHPERF